MCGLSFLVYTSFFFLYSAEKRPEAKHTTRDIVDILDDDYELQVLLVV
jgi:hypothetical protein